MLATVAASSLPSVEVSPPVPPALASFELASACAFLRTPDNDIFGVQTHGGRDKSIGKKILCILSINKKLMDT